MPYVTQDVMQGPTRLSMALNLVNDEFRVPFYG